MIYKSFLIIIYTLLFLFYLCIHQFTSYTQTISYKKTDINSVRICCLILTAPKYFHTRARAVNITWAPRCDKFLFISEYSNNTYYLPLAPIKNLTAGYEHLTKKTTLAFHYAYENFINQFDWFVKADDDTYIIIENLKIFLQKHNSSQPITFGYNFKVCLKLFCTR
jgi:glycoprotein-N-acetylgalactosamine 3-beta-galactosyltransferase